MTPADSKAITEEEILSALGKRISSEGQRSLFAKSLAEVLNNFIMNSQNAFPDRKQAEEAQRLFGRLSKLVDQAEGYTHEDSFIGNFLAACRPRLQERKLRTTTIQNVKEYVDAISELVKHERFLWAERGPDTRISKEVAYKIAWHYYRAFNRMPSVSGKGGRDDGSSKDTPYQRVCDLLAKKHSVRIGYSSQREALSHLRKTKDRPSIYAKFYSNF